MTKVVNVLSYIFMTIGAMLITGGAMCRLKLKSMR